jgi:exodeoxyribonuclease V alpha subunit
MNSTYNEVKLEKELNFHYDLVFIDESTMVNIFLFEDILVKLIESNPNVRIIFVGDKDQLPSIGPGQFFKDMLTEAKKTTGFKWLELKQIHRQENRQLQETIKSFLDKEKPIPANHKGFTYIEHDDNTYEDDIINIFETHRETLIENEEKYEDDEIWGNYLINSFQILSPQNKGITGVKDINAKIQKYLFTLGVLKPSNYICEYDGFSWYVGDKIINTRNDYENNPPAYNGQIGVITHRRDDGTIVVRFDNNDKDYYYDDIKDLKFNSKPAYCVTVHKSQGSGFKNVILFVNEHSTMWPTNGKPLLYTGASRCKEELFIIGNKETMKKAKESPDNIFTTLFKHHIYY